MSDTIDRVASSCIALVLKGSLHQEKESQYDQRVGRRPGDNPGVDTYLSDQFEITMEVG